MSNSLTFKELREEFERVKAEYLASQDVSYGLQLDRLGTELDRRIKEGDIE